jgi:hypothetical protein
MLRAQSAWDGETTQAVRHARHLRYIGTCGVQMG